MSALHDVCNMAMSYAQSEQEQAIVEEASQELARFEHEVTQHQWWQEQDIDIHWQEYCDELVG